MNCFTKIFAIGLLLMMFACTSNKTTDNTTQAPNTTNSTRSSGNNQNNVANGASAGTNANATTTIGKSSVTEVKSSYKNPEELREVFTVDKANTLGQQFGDRYCQCTKSQSAGECEKMMQKGIGNLKNVMKDNVKIAFEKALDYAKNNCK